MDLIVAGVTLALAGNGALSLMGGAISLTGGWPTVNGQVFHNASAQISSYTNGSIAATYDLGPNIGHFTVVASQGRDSGTILQYTLRDYPTGNSLNSFGIAFDAVAGMKRFYQSGYHSWDSSSYVQPDALSAFTGAQLAVEQSYAVTQLVPGDGSPSLVIGFDRHDRFQQTFTFGARMSPVNLTISTLWDQKNLDPAIGAVSENLWVSVDKSNEEGLRRWARVVAGGSPTAPRKSEPPLIGWDSWYFLYNFIDEALIRSSLAATSSVVNQQSLPMRTFLIDSGFTPELGDWLKTNSAFPNGMTGLLSDIRKAGFVPGLWIAPLLVGNRSDLYVNHPDWVLVNAATGGPWIWQTFYGEQRLGNMRSEEYYILDTTVPEAMDYLRTVFKTWKSVWGAGLFKVDFSYLLADLGPGQVRYHNAGMTRIEVWRQFAEMVRNQIGNDAIWVASGQPLWASVGLADTIRIAGDVGVSWSSGTASAQSLLQNLPMRNFANHILWQIDPDAVLLRTQYVNLSDTEVRSLALLAGMSGGSMVTSDDLSQIPAYRLNLWRMALGTTNQTCSYPLLGRSEVVYVPYQFPGAQVVPIAFSDPLIVQVRSVAGPAWLVHIVNTDSASISRTLTLTDLGIDGSQYVWDNFQMSSSSIPMTQLQVAIDPHSSVLLYLTSQPVTTGPATLVGNQGVFAHYSTGLSRH